MSGAAGAAGRPLRLKLYSYWRSSCSWRVRIALAHKGLAYEYAPVNLVSDGGEQHRAAYRAMNPMEQVPTLEIEEAGAVRRVVQSVAIVELLDELFPEPRLLPADPYLRAKTRALVEIVNSGTQPLQNLGVLQRVKNQLGGDDRAFARHFIANGLAALEAAARDVAGRFCVGDEVTAADVFLIPQLYNARRYDVDVAALPLLARIEEACAALPAFQAARAERQPDAPA